MSKKEAFSVLDSTLDNDFEETNPFQSPLVPVKSNMPEKVEEDRGVVRSDYYEVKAKLFSCLNFMVDNFETQAQAPGLLKTTPTNDVVELAKAIVYIDKQILSASDVNNKETSKHSGGDTNTQYNTFIGDSKGITAEAIDQMIKKAVNRSQPKPININNNKDK